MVEAWSWLEANQGQQATWKTYLIPFLLAHPFVIFPIAELGPPLWCVCELLDVSLYGDQNTHRIGKDNVDTPKLLNCLFDSSPRLISVGHVLW